MSESSLETPPPEPGLSTPHLNSHEKMTTVEPDQTITSIPEEKQPSVFDIAQGIEEELKKASQLLEKTDKEMNERIDTESKSNVESAVNNNDIPQTSDIPRTSDEIEVSNEIDSNLFKEFQEVFNKFTSRDSQENEEETNKTESTKATGKEIYYGDDDNEIGAEDSDDNSDVDNEEKSLSKRQLRIRNKVPLATLKASTSTPWNVDWYDVDSKDPYLLVALKSQANTIPVPAHWSAKRDYLSSKRGIEKLPFELPKYIRDTGIGEMRQTDERTIRQQQREKVQPKMGRLDIDYSKLHDAFFKYQTKPRIFGYGDVYEEGKEAIDEMVNEASKLKPGVISKELRDALDMPESDSSIPPPWITIMKDIGKPPSYQELLIPGLDMEYSNTGYKDRGSTGRAKKNNEYWGKLLDTVESSDGEQEDEDEESSGAESESESEIAEEGIEEGEKIEDNIEDNNSQEPVEQKKLENSNDSEKDNASKFLYKVLKEKSTKQDSTLLNTDFAYDLNPDQEPQSNSDEDTPKPEVVADIFKF
ncbi:Pre-mRNA-splicing factor [Spathaspora sp. JA1]|nr:Pre-mRNA-splicing factor [Spathaspora sp. JA1]